MKASRVILSVLLVCLVQVPVAQAQGLVLPSVINYQGKLINGTNLVNGNVEMTFRLYASPSGGVPNCTDSGTVAVVDGLYSTLIGDNVTWGGLDNALSQTQVWVEVVVGTNVLSPREQLVAVGYARYASGVPEGAIRSIHIGDGSIYREDILDGEIVSAKIANGGVSNVDLAAGAITGDKIANFSISNLNLAFGAVSSSVIEDGGVGHLDIADGAVRSNKIDWTRMPTGLQDGDDGQVYTAGTGLVIVGSTIAVSNGGIGSVQLADASVSSSKVHWASMPAGLQDGDDSGSLVSYDENGTFAPVPIASGSDSIAMGRGAVARADYSVVGGGRDNNIGTNSIYSAIGGGWSNNVADNSASATIGGGWYNDIGTNAASAVIGGGNDNNLGYNCVDATIGGGWYNNVADNGGYATIAGGRFNNIGANSGDSVIGGGREHNVGGSSQSATIAGGYNNNIGGSSQSATIAGGCNNDIGTNASFVAIGGGYDNNVGDNSHYAAMGGGWNNNVADDSASATIAGGCNNDIGTNAASAVIGGGNDNNLGYNCVDATIGGGWYNNVADNGGYATIAGGRFNNIGTNSSDSVIGGGDNNRVGYDSRFATIAGGQGNAISAISDSATVSGGKGNEVGSLSHYAAIAGGWNNNVSSNSSYAMIVGGQDNEVGANATNAFAAGRRAQALHEGALVWADSSDFFFASESNKQFNARAVGGFRFVTAIDGSGNPTAGARLHSGGGSWTSLSDRDFKTSFEPVDSRAILEKVVALPIETWQYKAQAPSIRHIGPVAQDFHEAFGVGEDPRGITSVDADGVALAAIQGLYQMLQEKDAQIAELRNEIEALKTQVK